MWRSVSGRSGRAAASSRSAAAASSGMTAPGASVRTAALIRRRIAAASSARSSIGPSNLRIVVPAVMGILNVPPDSFSDGGRYLDPAAAVAHGLRLVAEGASVVDVGGESTRPGAQPVDGAEERRRVVPVIEALAPHVRVSVDTRHP